MARKRMRRRGKNIFYLGGYRAIFVPFCFAVLGVLAWIPSSGCSADKRDTKEVSERLEEASEYFERSSEFLEKFGDLVEEVK